MDWNYSEKFTRNIGLKGFIQIHFTWVTTLTPLQWVDRGRDQGRRGEENQSSIHLMAENRCFVLALWGKPVNMELKVLTRHLHPMAYPGHHAGVTTDSSAQTEESVRLLIPRIALNYDGQKQRRTNRCHTNAPNVEQRPLLKNAGLGYLDIQQQKTEETIRKGSNWWNSALNSKGWPFIAK